MFAELPTFVLSNLLSSWLHIRDIARKVAREKLLQICQREAFSLLHADNGATQGQLSWLIVRRFHVASIRFESDTDVGLFIKVLTVTGKQLRRVSFREVQSHANMIAAISLVTLMCPNIVHLRCLFCSFHLSALDILSSCISLDSLNLEYCTYAGDLPSDLALLNLRHVSKIHVCSSIIFPFACVSALALFTGVQDLRLDAIPITDANLIQVAESCPHVHVLVLSKCTNFTENGLNFVIVRWKLNTLILDHSGNYTDELLQCISSSCVTLEVLLLTSANTFTNNAFDMVFRSCPYLNAVALGWYPITPQEFVTTTVPRLRNITTLALAQSLCSDTVLISIAKSCKHLEVLDIHDDTQNICILTGVGVAYVLRHCANLRVLITCAASANTPFNSPFIRSLLQIFRPQLQLQTEAVQHRFLT